MTSNAEIYQEEFPGLPLALALGVPRGTLWVLMYDLSDAEKTVINERFGLIDNQPKTLEQCVEILGSGDASRVLALESKAMSKLRHLAQQISLQWTSATWKPIEVCNHEICEIRVDQFIGKALQEQEAYQTDLRERYPDEFGDEDFFEEFYEALEVLEDLES